MAKPYDRFTFIGSLRSLVLAVNISEVYKTGLITCLIDRAYKISSTYQMFCSELEQLRKYFSKNKYPVEVMENSMRCKLNRIFSPSPTVSTVAKQDVK